MPNTRETLAAVLELLKDCSVECDIFGGWAEELLGSRQPWQHGDIDLIYRGAEFAPVDMAISYQHERFAEVAGKRFRHKRAFVFRETLCEIILVQDSSTTPTTYYWGDVPFRWHHPFLHHEPSTYTVSLQPSSLPQIFNGIATYGRIRSRTAGGALNLWNLEASFRQLRYDELLRRH